MFKRIQCLLMDIIAIPGLFMNKKWKAKWHLKFVCPFCPLWRKALGDLENEGKCWWYENWKKGNYGIPSNPGILNWLSRLLFLRTNLERIHRKYEAKNIFKGL